MATFPGYSSPLDEYDYVIVGGGTAGSVLAARLTEDKPKAMVLVIEAGRPESLLTDVPALLSVVQLDDFVWPYTMEHQPGVCLGESVYQNTVQYLLDEGVGSIILIVTLTLR